MRHKNNWVVLCLLCCLCTTQTVFASKLFNLTVEFILQKGIKYVSIVNSSSSKSKLFEHQLPKFIRSKSVQKQDTNFDSIDLYLFVFDSQAQFLDSFGAVARTQRHSGRNCYLCGHPRSWERLRLQTHEAENAPSWESSKLRTLEAESARSWERSKLTTLEAENAPSWESSKLRTLNAENAQCWERSKLRTLKAENAQSWEHSKIFGCPHNYLAISSTLTLLSLDFFFHFRGWEKKLLLSEHKPIFN